jgi:formylglycine-generating enzyme required for sulfatase activity
VFSIRLASGGQSVEREMTITVISGDLGFGFGDDQFVLIPAGSFQMGDANGSDDENPVHPVTITKAFYLQKTEVTQSQWLSVMGTNPSAFAGCGDACPVEKVSWDDIQTFILTLNAQDLEADYRLPTEAEWEYAARAGTTGSYGGTGSLDEMGWYSENSGRRTQFVGLKPPNAWGLFDMHGNVYEWVQDWYSADYYGVSPVEDPQGPFEGTRKLLRGGSADQGAEAARSANRLNSAPSSAGFTIYFGFRLVRVVQ